MIYKTSYLKSRKSKLYVNQLKLPVSLEPSHQLLSAQ